MISLVVHSQSLPVPPVIVFGSSSQGCVCCVALRPLRRLTCIVFLDQSACKILSPVA